MKLHEMAECRLDGENFFQSQLSYYAYRRAASLVFDAIEYTNAVICCCHYSPDIVLNVEMYVINSIPNGMMNINTNVNVV